MNEAFELNGNPLSRIPYMVGYAVMVVIGIFVLIILGEESFIGVYIGVFVWTAFLDWKRLKFLGKPEWWLLFKLLPYAPIPFFILLTFLKPPGGDDGMLKDTIFDPYPSGQTAT